ncbi:hypothetical protein GCM10007906_06480 [Vibrio hyugaensis]|uniref:Uncharacterized protein n=1 Tax=Vibrio hyugaensis TaxID=1534743 RepID=A0ABQ5XWE9_9VIBR|nr:hypothetical protein GCM10007906_06480 [Vibrio hyugaensis]
MLNNYEFIAKVTFESLFNERRICVVNDSLRNQLFGDKSSISVNSRWCLGKRRESGQVKFDKIVTGEMKKGERLLSFSNA